MTSYFEIGGHIVECVHYDTSLSSSYSAATVAERPERGRNLAKSERGVTPEMPADSLFEHWKQTTFHPLREFSQLPGKRQVGLITRPHVFALWGVHKGLKVVEMHRDYFLR